MQLALALANETPVCDACGEPYMPLTDGLCHACAAATPPDTCPTCGSLSPWRCGCHHDFDDKGD
jgi:hypothetical protein